MSSFLTEALEGKIDFEGQKLADSLVRNVLIASSTVAFILGFVFQSLRVTFGFIALATILLIVAVVPPWSVYRKHPIRWLPVKKEAKKD